MYLTIRLQRIIWLTVFFSSTYVNIISCNLFNFCNKFYPDWWLYSYFMKLLIIGCNFMCAGSIMVIFTYTFWIFPGCFAATTSFDGKIAHVTFIGHTQTEYVAQCVGFVYTDCFTVLGKQMQSPVSAHDCNEKHSSTESQHFCAISCHYSGMI